MVHEGAGANCKALFAVVDVTKNEIYNIREYIIIQESVLDSRAFESFDFSDSTGSFSSDNSLILVDSEKHKRRA